MLMIETKHYLRESLNFWNNKGTQQKKTLKMLKTSFKPQLNSFNDLKVKAKIRLKQHIKYLFPHRKRNSARELRRYRRVKMC
jgi:hypothetical protein